MKVIYEIILFVTINMSYYWFNREELLKKANEKYHNKGGKQKAGEYYKKNKEAIKEKQETSIKN